MPFAYPDQPLIKAAIVARVLAGETVTAICSAAGMPDKASVQVWRRADPAFAAELAQARRVAEHRRRYPYDAAVARAFLARVAAGERMRDLLAKPGMPSQGAYAHWRRTEPPFQEALWRLRGARYVHQSGQEHGRWRPYDAAVADKILARAWMGMGLRAILRSDPIYPALAVLARWRREQPEFDRTLRGMMRAAKRAGLHAHRRFTPELAAAVLDGVVSGGSLRSLAAQPDMPCARTLYSWVRKHPAFAEELAQAGEMRRDWYIDQMLDRVERAGPTTARARQRLTADLSQQLGRLEKRPGWKAQRRG